MLTGSSPGEGWGGSGLGVLPGSGCWGVCEAPRKGRSQDSLQQRLQLGFEEGTVRRAEARLPVGWACFTHLTTQRRLLVSSHPS